jgi:hypothetical protein
MNVVAMVNLDRPIIRICDLDQADEYAEIEFATQEEANAAVTPLNEIIKTATHIDFKSAA